MDMIADRFIATRARDVAGGGRGGRAAQAHAGHRPPGRRDAGQRGELPDQEVLHGGSARCPWRTRPAYDTPPRCPVWGPRSGAAAPPPSSRTSPTATASSIMGSNMAENHPVGFQWVMEAKQRGAKLIHVDPRFTRTSALADTHVPLRAGSATSPSSAGSSATSSRTSATSATTSSAYTNAPAIIRRGLRRHRGPRRAVLGLGPRDAHLRLDDLAVRGRGHHQRRGPTRAGSGHW